MRWESLFDDLESQLQRELDAEASDLQAEDERLRLGGLGMRGRLEALASAGASVGPVQLTLTGGDRVSVTPGTFGDDWFTATVTDRSGQIIVPLSSITGVTMTRAQVVASLTSGGRTAALRLGLAVVLRDLCRRRRGIELVLVDGSVRGTIDRVGLDHLDIAVHEPGSARRDRAVSEFRLVPFAAVQLIRV